MNEISQTADNEFIYHLAQGSDFFTNIINNLYSPASLINDGFIHCSKEEDSTVLISNEFFSKAKQLFILKIRLNKIMAKVMFEYPKSAAKENEGNSRLNKILFSHIYGSLNLDAIEGMAIMPKINYVFHFPKAFYSYSQFKEVIYGIKR